MTSIEKHKDYTRFPIRHIVIVIFVEITLGMSKTHCIRVYVAALKSLSSNRTRNKEQEIQHHNLI